LLETGYFGIKFCDYLFGSHTGSLSATPQRGSPTRAERPSCFAERITFDSSRREQVSVPLANLRNHARPACSKADSASHTLQKLSYETCLYRSKTAKSDYLRRSLDRHPIRASNGNEGRVVPRVCRTVRTPRNQRMGRRRLRSPILLGTKRRRSCWMRGSA
jgi:hypothetical protein